MSKFSALAFAVLLSILPATSEASVISVHVTGTVADGPLAGESGGGFIRADLSQAYDYGEGLFVDPFNGFLGMGFYFLDESFRGYQAAEYPYWPQFTFGYDGTLLSIDFTISEVKDESWGAFKEVPIDRPGVALFGLTDPVANGKTARDPILRRTAESYDVTIYVELYDTYPVSPPLAPVPLPATAGLLAAALAGLALRRRLVPKGAGG